MYEEKDKLRKNPVWLRLEKGITRELAFSHTFLSSLIKVGFAVL